MCIHFLRKCPRDDSTALLTKLSDQACENVLNVRTLWCDRESQESFLHRRICTNVFISHKWHWQPRIDASREVPVYYWRRYGCKRCSRTINKWKSVQRSKIQQKIDRAQHNGRQLQDADADTDTDVGVGSDVESGVESDVESDVDPDVDADTDTEWAVTSTRSLTPQDQKEQDDDLDKHTDGVHGKRHIGHKHDKTGRPTSTMTSHGQHPAKNARNTDGKGRGTSFEIRRDVAVTTAPETAAKAVSSSHTAEKTGDGFARGEIAHAMAVKRTRKAGNVAPVGENPASRVQASPAGGIDQALNLLEGLVKTIPETPSLEIGDAVRDGSFRRALKRGFAQSCDGVHPSTNSAHVAMTSNEPATKKIKPEEGTQESEKMILRLRTEKAALLDTMFVLNTKATAAASEAAALRQAVLAAEKRSAHEALHWSHKIAQSRRDSINRGLVSSAEHKRLKEEIEKLKADLTEGRKRVAELEKHDAANDNIRQSLPNESDQAATRVEEKVLQQVQQHQVSTQGFLAEINTPSNSPSPSASAPFKSTAPPIMVISAWELLQQQPSTRASLKLRPFAGATSAFASPETPRGDPTT